MMKQEAMVGLLDGFFATGWGNGSGDVGSPTPLFIGGLAREQLPNQGAMVRAEYDHVTTTIDSTCSNVVAEAFSRTFGQPLISFLADNKPAEERPPIRMGVVLSGSQSLGGHNVVWGLHDALKAYNSQRQSVLYGFFGNPPTSYLLSSIYSSEIL